MIRGEHKKICKQTNQDLFIKAPAKIVCSCETKCEYSCIYNRLIDLNNDRYLVVSCVFGTEKKHKTPNELIPLSP